MTGKVLITIICFIHVLLSLIFTFKTKNHNSIFIPFNNSHTNALNIPISILFLISTLELIFIFLEFIATHWNKQIF